MGVGPKTIKAASTERIYSSIRTRKVISPRVANALRLYNSGVARTKKEAAEMAGLSSAGFYMPTMPSLGKTAMSAYGQMISDSIQEKAINVGALLDGLAVQAVATINHIRNEGASEALRLKAAIDLADRGSKTSKVQKLSVESFTLNNKDVEAISAAMLESREVLQLKGEVQGHYEETYTEPKKG